MHDEVDEVRRLAAQLPERPRDVATTRSAKRRPDRATVQRLLDLNGQTVIYTDHKIIEDVDGLPNHIETETGPATLVAPSIELLGWTAAEWADPTITE